MKSNQQTPGTKVSGVCCTSGGAARLFMTAGSTIYGEIVSSSDWTRSEITLTIPEGVTNVTIGAVQTSADVVYLDDFQFEKAESASRYNLVTDGDMTYSTYPIAKDYPVWTPFHWSNKKYEENEDGELIPVKGVAGDDIKVPAYNETEDWTVLADSVADPHGGLDGAIMYMDASTGVDKNASQTIYIPDGAAGDVYTFGTWVHTISAPLDNSRGPGQSGERTSGIRLEAFLGDSEDPVAEETILANDTCRTWQFLSGKLNVNEAYDRVVVTLLHDYNIEESCYDGVQVFRESFGYYYDYDDDGNITSVTDLEGEKTEYTYVSGTSDVSKIKLPSGAIYAYSYNSNRQLTGTTSATGVKTTHSYDDYGNATGTTITYANNSGQVIKSETTYTSDHNMTASVTSGDRSTVTYSNDTDSSLVESVTDAKGNVTSYDYDTMRRQIGVTQGSSTLNYTYADDLLKSITHSGGTNTTYNFAYTVGGLTDTVKVGGEYILSENTYNSEIWTLAREYHGTGGSWYYTYTDYNDLESKYTLPLFGTGVEFRYYYNNEGDLARIERYDATISNATVTARTLVGAERYYYDGSNRLSKLVETNASGAVTHKYEWTYDHNDNVVSLTETIGSKTYTYNYTYNDDQIATGVTYGATSETIAFDGYGRTSSTTIKNNSTARLTTSYAYNSIGGYTTNQIGTLNNNYGGSNHNLTYTYDANGNILTVSDGTNTTTYTYDSLNQLLSEKNQAAGKSWVYTYDTGGNITSKTEYTNATASGTGTVYNYAYGDAAWGDLLTTYNGKALTYGTGGELQTYNGFTYLWMGDMKLHKITNWSGTTYTYAYNDSGLRTTKNTGSATHNYTYQGTQLTSDVTSSDALHFHYDQNGAILGFTYVSGSSSAEYYYVKNLQGDVIGILDASGNQVASYTYNAWGEILSVGGSNTTLANRNPIRYRSYYYDRETNLYYLQSRYYSPELCRFICPDKYTQTYECAVGANMFAYCLNNPVNKVDGTGDFAIAAPILGCLVGAAIGATFSAMTAVATGGDVGAAIVVGAINGAICAVPFTPSTMAFKVGVSLMKSSATMLVDFGAQMRTDSENVDLGGIVTTGAATFVGSMIGAALPGYCEFWKALDDMAVIAGNAAASMHVGAIDMLWRTFVYEWCEEKSDDNAIVPNTYRTDRLQ